jgi:chromosome segregation ATPase
MALSDDLAALTDTNSEIDRLRAQLAAKEAERETQRAKIRSYQATLDKALTSLDEEKNQLIAMRERLFVTGLQQKDNKVLAGQSTQQALQKAKGGWCRLWIDV